MKINRSQFQKLLIALLVIFIAFIGVRNKILLNHSIKQNHLLKEQYSQLSENTQKIQEALIKAHFASMIHLGTTIQLLNIEQIFPQPTHTTTPPVPKHPRLLLVFSELSCNVCQDAETQFGISIANDYGQDYVTAIIYATQRRYVSSYVRMNQVNFPVFFCKNDSFFKLNHIQNTPMIFIIDQENRIIASHFPLPGHLEYSEPIHRFCYYYFNQAQK